MRRLEFHVRLDYPFNQCSFWYLQNTNCSSDVAHKGVNHFHFANVGQEKRVSSALRKQLHAYRI